MNALQVALLVGLVVVALVHVTDRLFGALAGTAWCVLAIAWGLLAYRGGAEVQFLEIPVRPWAFVVFMAVLVVYNGFVVVRLTRMRRRQRQAAADVARGPSGGERA